MERQLSGDLTQGSLSDLPVQTSDASEVRVSQQFRSARAAKEGYARARRPRGLEVIALWAA